MSGVTNKEEKAVQKIATSISEEKLHENGEKVIEKTKLFSSSSNLSNSKTQLCHVSVSSSENLKTIGNEIAKNEFLKPDEVMAWLIKPIDTSKFFKYVLRICIIII